MTELLVLSDIRVSLCALHFNLTGSLVMLLLFCHFVHPDAHDVKRIPCHLPSIFFRHAVNLPFHFVVVFCTYNVDISWLAPRSLFADRKSTRLNSSHRTISYAVFCLKKKKKNK